MTLRDLYFAWRSIGFKASTAFKLARWGIDPTKVRVRIAEGPAVWEPIESQPGTGSFATSPA